MSLALFFIPLMAVILSWGSVRTELLLCFNMLVLFVLSGVNYYECVVLGAVKHVQILQGFIPSGLTLSQGLQPDKFGLDVYLDFYSSQMVFLVSLISLGVHLYSIQYMKDDPRLGVFMVYLSVFTLFMVVYVVSLNFIQLFIGWEGIGITSYLLVNFWHTRPQANKSALKALIVNRFGDYFFLFAILLMVADNGPKSVVEPVELSYWVSFFFVLAAAAKSAQLGLHTWLADAMEGPTPVSALIHAATMVTAGVYLLVRLGSSLEELQPLMLLLGGLTTVYAGLAALFQSDLKRVIAYSTCAQLGYMVAALGAGAQQLGFYHLVNHAYFKALLFLAAGLVIHSLNNEQDFRRMGGLYRVLPFVYVCFLVASLSLGGVPFLSGYYSKDGILEVLYAGNHFFAYGCLLFGAYLTVLYSWRVLFLVFWSSIKSSPVLYRSLHESDPLSVGVLTVLLLFSVVHGWLTRDLFIGLGQTPEWLVYNVESEFYPSLWVKLLPLSSLAVALGVSLVPEVEAHRGWSTFFAKRLAFDVLDATVTRGFLRFCYLFYSRFERGLLEWLGASGLDRSTWFVFRRVHLSGWFVSFFLLISLAFVFISLGGVGTAFTFCLSYNRKT